MLTYADEAVQRTALDYVTDVCEGRIFPEALVVAASGERPRAAVLALAILSFLTTPLDVLERPEPDEQDVRGILAVELAAAWLARWRVDRAARAHLEETLAVEYDAPSAHAAC